MIKPDPSEGLKMLRRANDMDPISPGYPNGFGVKVDEEDGSLPIPGCLEAIYVNRHSEAALKYLTTMPCDGELAEDVGGSIAQVFFYNPIKIMKLCKLDSQYAIEDDYMGPLVAGEIENDRTKRAEVARLLKESRKHPGRDWQRLRKYLTYVMSVVKSEEKEQSNEKKRHRKVG